MGEWEDILLAIYTRQTKNVQKALRKDPNLVRQKSDKALLVYACEFGNTCTVRTLLAAKADPEVYDGSKQTPLMAVSKNQEFGGEIVELLVKKRAYINLVPAQETPALILATIEGNTKVVQTLIQCSAHPNICDGYGQTALMVASRRNMLTAVKTLLAGKANPNLKCHRGDTALTNACCVPLSRGTVDVLLRGQADPNIKDGLGNTGLMYAVGLSDASQDTVELLLAGKSSINLQNPGEWSALTHAVTKSHTPSREAAVELLVLCQANLELTECSGKTALIVALTHLPEDSAISTVDLLLRCGADINAETLDGHTALITAVRAKFGKTTELLLSRGANIDHRDKRGRTALFYASYLGDINILRQLRNSDPNIQATDKGTALMFAASVSNDQSVLEFLISIKADAALQNYKGMTALMLFLKHQDTNAHVPQALAAKLRSTRLTKMETQL